MSILKCSLLFIQNDKFWDVKSSCSNLKTRSEFGNTPHYSHNIPQNITPSAPRHKVQGLNTLLLKDFFHLVFYRALAQSFPCFG